MFFFVNSSQNLFFSFAGKEPFFLFLPYLNLLVTKVTNLITGYKDKTFNTVNTSFMKMVLFIEP